MKYLYFTANWCGPCKRFGPIMEQVSQLGIPVLRIDVDQNSRLTSKYTVRNVPTLILVDEFERELYRKIGVQNQQTIVENFNRFRNG
jgi:thioredoxin 1